VVFTDVTNAAHLYNPVNDQAIPAKPLAPSHPRGLGSAASVCFKPPTEKMEEKKRETKRIKI